MDLFTFARDPDAMALRVAAGDVFGVLTRRLELPPGCAALLTRDDGSTAAAAPGSTVESRGVRELVIVRTAPLRLVFDEQRVESQDGFECAVGLTISVAAVPERSDLEAFCRNILGSSRRANVRRLVLHLRDAVQKCVHDFAAATPADDLVHSSRDDEFAQRLRESLKATAFQSGLSLGRTILLDATSPAYEQARQSEQQADAEQQRIAAQSRVREAATAARLRHVQDLSAVLDRLDGLAKQRPGVSMAELMRTFDVHERGELHRQLLAREITARRTAAIAVVAGNEMLLFNPADGALIRRRAFDVPLGPLRSIRLTRNGGETGFLIGAANGVYECGPQGERVVAYRFEPPRKLRGGVNAAVVLGDSVYATHSEVGVLHWRIDDAESARFILGEHTTAAASVRDIQADEQGTLWFSAGDRVVGWSPEAAGPVRSAALPDMDASPPGHAQFDDRGEDDAEFPPTPSVPAGPRKPATPAPGASTTLHVPGAAATSTGTLVSVGSIGGGGGAPRVTALCVAGGDVFAGTSDGRLLAWPCRGPQRVEVLLSGEGGGVESVQWMSGGGVERLLVSCRRPTVWLLARGDAWRGEYRADEPLRWAAAADDWIVAVNDRRDRLFLWRPAQPDVTPRTILAARLAGHSIQDVVLVPQDC